MNFKGIELCCPICKGDLDWSTAAGDELACAACRRRFPVRHGIPDLRIFPDPYIGCVADRAKGARVAERLDDLSFVELVDFYYGMTDVVPPQHARLYRRGLLAAPARAESTLASWEARIGAGARPNGPWLEIGCGTGPLIVAAAARGVPVVGVDIAFRWLVVAKKRLAEAGVDAPLICACAEALPFPAGRFDRVVAESALEHLADQRRALAECRRVVRSGGYLAASTPNRFSLGPDPQAGIWGGSLLPDRLIAVLVRRQGGIPPRRHLLSARSLARLVEAAGFERPRVFLPEVPAGQRRHFGRGLGLLIDAYGVARTAPVARELLRWIGPQLLVVAGSPTAAQAPAGAGRQPAFVA